MYAAAIIIPFFLAFATNSIFNLIQSLADRFLAKEE
jgi:hypothetical protein